MQRTLSFAFLAVGIVLLILGGIATDSVSSSISRAFTGAPTDKSIWLLGLGLVAVAVGAGSLFGSGRKP